MNHQTQWLISDQVLYWKLVGDVKSEEFQEGLVELNNILEKANNKIHVVVNARNARSLQGDTNAVRAIAKITAHHNRMGSFVVISHSFKFRHHLNRVTAAFGTHLRYFDSLRNAWYCLHKIDMSLPFIAPQLPTLSKDGQYA